jgi:sugar O-acyltransferase (sialic acid O-acetyltransferase NeuD family)
MKKQDIILVGTGATAQVYCSQIEQYSHYKVIAFTAEQPFCGESLLGKPVFDINVLPKFFNKGTHFFVCVGYNDMNVLRASLLFKMKKLEFNPISYISPSAIISCNALLGEHCYIGDNVCIQPYAKIDNDVTILPGCTIGHHTKIYEHVYICQNVNINGFISIKNNAFIGASATILDGVTIGHYSFIGAGAQVRASVPDETFCSPFNNTLHPNAREKFAAWFAERQNYYAVFDY